MLDLEKALREDECGEYMHEFVAKLAHYGTDITQYLNRGVPPDEYQRLARLQQSISVACDVVQKVWRQYHRAS